MKEAIAGLARAVLRLYTRYGPSGWAKKALWEAVIEPYLGWRRFETVARTKHGPRLQLVLPEAIDTRLYYFGLWEPNITAYVVRTLQKGDCFVDIGAHIGYYSLIAASLVGPQGSVYAIESSPATYRSLLRNLDLNSAGNVSARNLAVYDSRKNLKVFRGAENSLLTTTVADKPTDARFVFETEVEAAPISEIVPPQDLLRARLIKIDVEGAEWFVVRGMQTLLSEMSRDTEIIVEVTPDQMIRQGGDVITFLGMFKEAGFDPYVIPNDYSISAYCGNSSVVEPSRLESDVMVKQSDVLFRRRS